MGDFELGFIGGAIVMLLFIALLYALFPCPPGPMTAWKLARRVRNGERFKLTDDFCSRCSHHTGVLANHPVTAPCHCPECGCVLDDFACDNEECHSGQLEDGSKCPRCCGTFWLHDRSWCSACGGSDPKCSICVRPHSDGLQI